MITRPGTFLISSRQRAAVVAALFGVRPDPAVNVGFVQVKHISDVAMQVLVATGERFKLNPRATSDIMKIMGFIERDRSNSGSLFALSKETVIKIHRLEAYPQCPVARVLRT